jgi:hypothetical protein
MDLKKALIRQFQFDRVSYVLRQIDSTLNLAKISKPGELPETLLRRGLIEKVGADWLADEIEVLASLQ